MKKRCSILAREIGSGREIELCQVESNPERVAEAAGMKVLRMRSSGRRARIKRYDWIHIVDNGEASTIPHIRAEKPPDNADTTPIGERLCAAPNRGQASTVKDWQRKTAARSRRGAGRERR
jgi:hypothetical protein